MDYIDALIIMLISTQSNVTGDVYIDTGGYFIGIRVSPSFDEFEFLRYFFPTELFLPLLIRCLSVASQTGYLHW